MNIESMLERMRHWRLPACTAAQGSDETECYALSKYQTGVDPFMAPAPDAVERAAFDKAFIACLTPRGYTVN